MNDIYVYELARLWPASAIIQSLLLVIVWVHGCMGIHFWLRLYPPYRRIFPLLLALAVIIPLAALGGFAVAGSTVAAAIEMPSVFANLKVLTRWPDALAGETLGWLRNLARIEFARGAGRRERLPRLDVLRPSRRPEGDRRLHRRADRQGAARADAARDQPHEARAARFGLRRPRALLDLPRAHRARLVRAAAAGISRKRHARQHRCAAQRASRLPDPARALSRRHAPVEVRQHRARKGADIEEADSAGVEKTLVVMFVDLRDFTRLSEKRLPFDIVYVLNEFFGVVGAAITAHGGWIDKFLGDGLLAVFGQRDGVDAGCRQALRTARDIDLALDRINASSRPSSAGRSRSASASMPGRCCSAASATATRWTSPSSATPSMSPAGSKR